MQSAPSTTKHVASTAHPQKTTPAAPHKGSTPKTNKPTTGRPTTAKPKTTKREKATTKSRKFKSSPNILYYFFLIGSLTGRKKRLSQWDWA